MKARYGLKFSGWSLSSSFPALVITLAIACKPAAEDRNVVIAEAAKEDRNALSADKINKLTIYMQELNVTDVADKMLLVIPTQGCVPCIDEALKFTAATEQTARLTILLSGTNKRLKSLTAHKYKIDPGKMLYDADNRAVKYGLITIYPALFWEDKPGHFSAMHLAAGDIQRKFPGVGLKVVGL